MNGFKVIEEKEISHYHGKLTYLVHERTGLKVAHFYTDRGDKFFSYSVKTPIPNDKGVAHVLEHCILQGSRKYPMADSINEYAKVSPKICMNAFTAQFYTSFFAESACEKDFFNLQDMISDAVFFPLLTDEAFMSEGWHVELGKDHKVTVNGIVFNEMNSPAKNLSASNHKDFLSCFKGGEAYPSIGGFPADIVDLTVSEVRDFHKKYYVPANCLVTVIGDVPLEKELEFLEKNLMESLPAGTEEVKIDFPIVPIKKYVERSRITEGSEKSTALSYKVILPELDDRLSRKINYLLGVIKGYLHRNHISNPFEAVERFRYGLVAKNIYVEYEMSLIKSKNLKAVKKYIVEKMESICREGIPLESVKEILDADMKALKSEGLDFDYDDIQNNIIGGWKKECNPMHEFILGVEEDMADCQEAVLAEDGKLLLDLLHRYVVDEPLYREMVTVYERENASKDVEKLIAKKLKKVLRKADMDAVKLNMEYLKEYEDRAFTEEQWDALPKLSVDDLVLKNNLEKPCEDLVKTANGEVKIISSVKDLKENSTVSFMYCLDGIDAYKEMCLIYYFKIRSCLGTLKMNKQEYSGYLLKEMMFSPSWETLEQYLADFDSDEELRGHRWFQFSFDMGNENLGKMSKLILDDYLRPNLDCKEDMDCNRRLFELEKQYFCKEVVYTPDNIYNEINALFNKGYDFDSYSRGCKSGEMAEEVNKLSLEELYEKGREAFLDMIHGPACATVIASSEYMDEVKKQVAQVLVENGNCGVVPTDKYCNYEEVRGERMNSALLPDVGNSAVLVFRSSAYPAKEYAAEYMYMKWLENSDLYKELRVKEGAYDASTFCSLETRMVGFSVTRTPAPRKALDAVMGLLERMTEYEFTDRDILAMVMKYYGDRSGWSSQAERGSYAICTKFLKSGVELFEENYRNTLSMTKEDLHQAAVRIWERARDEGRCLVLTPNPEQLDGNVIYDYRKV